MKTTITRVFFSCILLLIPGPVAFAQEGHPYKGTWRGTIGDGDAGRSIVVIMDYDGENITGLINPGRNSYRFDAAELVAPQWLLTVAATTREGSAIGFSGTMHEIGAPDRHIEGRWTEGGRSEPFRITRE